MRISLFGQIRFVRIEMISSNDLWFKGLPGVVKARRSQVSRVFSARISHS